ncbi:hypothetical protein QTO34_002523 [Cnephaeus nilssonii]|uniref:Uncharacterized protein n=1 Tax=Cnephaeus nilssonii TaxID=3371016 RepID=A0AA40LM54_CNENI|nr:hypothetical protein QTO34_002523 [Eptesicus nilssonii]
MSTTADGARPPLYSHIRKDRRCAGLAGDQLPSCAGLKDTIASALPFGNEEIVPPSRRGHGY